MSSARKLRRRQGLRIAKEAARAIGESQKSAAQLVKEVLADREARGVLEKAQGDAASKAIVIAGTIVAKVLRDSFGFGDKRLSKIYDECLVQWDCMRQGYVDLAELRVELLREMPELRKHLKERGLLVEGSGNS